jgi:uncharacterized protein (DUF983 family)
MAQSTCIRCNSRSFETEAHIFFGDRVVFFQCSNCGGVVGVHGADDLGALLGNVLAGLATIAAELRRLRLAG